ncbi:MAG TPA: hypothetical protein VD862_04435 [Candidatus Paceibacterota bacterium]|nr:hypothetical protein [Candidatus Paceibacterota bacterium]
MYPIIWFALVTALAVAYAVRADTTWGPQKRFYIEWPHAVAIALAVIVAGLLIGRGVPEAVTPQPAVKPATTTAPAVPPPVSVPAPGHAPGKTPTPATHDAKPGPAIPPEAFVAFHAVGIAYAAFAGLVLWRRENWSPYAAAFAAMAVTVAYFTWSGVHEVGNTVLLLVALGFSLLGRTATQKGFIVAYILLMLFDGFAVWGSDLMNRIALHYPEAFPKFLRMAGYGGLATGIGAGDVLFAAIACNHIHQHRGFRRAVFFAVACTVGVLVGILMPGQTPLLIFVTPVAIAALLIPQGWLRID